MIITTTIDVRLYEPKEKHPTIIRTFESLQKGEVMEIVNDHDPLPLRYQFMIEYVDQFEWHYLEEGPDVWRVSIIKK
ncbi:DUF2249 domain-containing protein [Metabacillus malikii]|uniref:Uncharacterized protein (DUF2249 family) n=1 Tax=Metabacillus malikii TaxID=1504265 RepID=A0ABT9ZB99_9BACI|nr:DUF2249 domain-containing protein [Metabacillus malikii]MDQ0229275.1 uncharacterized protein (DUF2249 family) [Metabacillus malikii]